MLAKNNAININIMYNINLQEDMLSCGIKSEKTQVSKNDGDIILTHISIFNAHHGFRGVYVH